MSARHNTLEDARGRWREILGGLGIDKIFLRNKHGPCPMCGGTDRYRWDDKEGTGSYYCSQCGPGSGMALLMKFHGWKFKEACARVDAFLGNNYTIDAKPIERKPPPPIRDDRDKRRHAIERVLREATAPDIVEEYLASRGISELPEPLRGHRGLNLWDEDRRLVGRFAAVVAPVLGPAGEIQSAQRIYLCEPRIKKLMPAIDTVAGGAVRLFEPTESLGIAEGIETACGAYEIFRIPTWSVISTGGIESFVPPLGITTLTVFADADRNYAGQKAAFVLANRLATDKRFRNIEIDVKVPSRPDTDWLDELNALRPAAPARGEARP